MKALVQLPLAALRDLTQGCVVAATIAVAALFIAEHHGGPALLYALLLGMAFHFLASDARAEPGIRFSSGTLLRIGVALLGARITLDEIVALGAPTIALVLLAVVATLLFSLLLARRLRTSAAEAALAGGAVAICGAAAALTIAAAMPAGRVRESWVMGIVVGVTALSTVAMLVYPLLVSLLGLAPVAAGVFIGATIHDVAQVVGAGYMMGPQIGDTATMTKMLRVTALMPVALVLGGVFSRAGQIAPSRLGRPPLFLAGFALLVALNSFGALGATAPLLADVSRGCIVMAIAALGVKTSLGDLRKLGWAPLALLSLSSAFIAVFVLAGLAVAK